MQDRKCQRLIIASATSLALDPRPSFTLLSPPRMTRPVSAADTSSIVIPAKAGMPAKPMVRWWAIVCRIAAYGDEVRAIVPDTDSQTGRRSGDR